MFFIKILKVLLIIFNLLFFAFILKISVFYIILLLNLFLLLFLRLHMLYKVIESFV